MAFAGKIGGLFVDNDPLYNEFTGHFIRIYMMAFFIYGPPMATASFFQAIGKPARALVISLSRQMFFLVPLAVTLSGIFGLNGALAAAPAADVLTFILAAALIIFEMKGWKRKNMI